MTREIKFRAYGPNTKTMWTYEEMKDRIALAWLNDSRHESIVMQFTGLQDKNGVDIYEGDICEFEGGDTFIVRIEYWLECYGEWIGEPECEDQLRDFYRARNSTVIGNIHENPELLDDA